MNSLNIDLLNISNITVHGAALSSARARPPSCSCPRRGKSQHHGFPRPSLLSNSSSKLGSLMLPGAMGPEHLVLVGHHIWHLTILLYQTVALDTCPMLCNLLLGSLVLPLHGHGGYPDSFRLEEICLLTVLKDVENRQIPVFLDSQVIIGARRLLRGLPSANPMLEPIKLDLHKN